ncbi:MAG TPA: peroxiredoxin, partial [Halothiobacillus sp.]|nr:peroxiredoxin [Halothiobacillus sp.]
MKARVKWVEGMAFMAESDSGHGIMLDGSPDIGGRNLGVRPMEMVLMGLGGCTAIDVMV